MSDKIKSNLRKQIKILRIPEIFNPNEISLDSSHFIARHSCDPTNQPIEGKLLGTRVAASDTQKMKTKFDPKHP